MEETEVLYKHFTEFEKSYKLLSSDNIYSFIWERIRFEIFRSLQEKKLKFGQAHSSEKKSNLTFEKRLKIFQYFLINSIRRNPFLFSNKYKYIFWSGGRRVWDSNHKVYYNVNIEPFIDYLSPKNCLLIEEPTVNRHYNPVYTKNICYSDFFLLLRAFLRKLFKNKYFEKILFKYYNKIENYFSNYFKEHIPIADNAILTFRQYKADIPIFNLFFKFHHPDIFFIICSYGNENIIEAAKKNNIPVVEIQHGLIAKGDTAGYDIPNNCKKDSFPDYFLSYGEYWIKNINFPIPLKNIFNVGFPFLTEQSNNYNSIIKKEQIVFISQGIYGKHLSQFAISLYEKSPNSVQIIFKLHPGEWDRWKQEYSELAQYSKMKKIKVIDNSETIHNYRLLAESKWVCGVNSTLIFESIFFYCKIFILNLPGHYTMNSLIENKIAVLISTTEEILLAYNDEINSNIFSKAKYYFANNWKEEFFTALLKIYDNLNNNLHFLQKTKI